MELKVVELFAGVGGFRVGLNHIARVNDINGKAIENGDWDFVWANQYEPSTKLQHAYECYKKRFGEFRISNVDISKVNKNEIPKHSLLVGGFPCQDYSVARSLKNEKGIEGKKGVLFWDIKEILNIKNSPFVLLENVDRLLKSPSSKRGRDFAIMLKTFDELGYNVHWRVINAADYSMPQKRKRVFIFAYKKNSKYSKSVSLNLNNNIFNRVFTIELKNIEKKYLVDYNDIIDVNDNYNQGKFLDCGMMINGEVLNSDFNVNKETPIYTLGKVVESAREYINDYTSYIVEDDKLEKWKYLKGAKKIERKSKNGHKYVYSEGKMSFPDDLTEPARTMLTSESSINRSSHIIYDKELNKYRLLTEVECEMIQMFPPKWTDTMTKKRRYFMMGNALVTGIISRMEPILKEIILSE